jgi:diaminopimelate epimerase
LLMDLPFPIAFTKMSGAGNDFVVLDHRLRYIAVAHQPEFARLICRRRFSAGADGLVLLEDGAGADFGWHFYNSDGSRAEMCGNAARCAARFAHVRGLAGRDMSFVTDAGIIEAHIENDMQVSVKMTEPAGFCQGAEILLDEQPVTPYFINTGVPHAVIFTEAEQAPVTRWGALVRHHHQFGAAGTNVNFVARGDDDSLFVRTYERGVEAETMACGTGIVAAALVAERCGMVRLPVAVQSAGGSRLEVSADTGGVFLRGEARFIYDGSLSDEAFSWDG